MGGENYNNPYYATDAAQQQQNNVYQGQPQYGQPPGGGIQINVNKNGPPPPPQRGRGHHLGALHINVLDYPIDVKKCSRCMRDTDTYCRYKYGSLVWIMCLVFFCFSVCLFWVPFCIDEWKDK